MGENYSRELSVIRPDLGAIGGNNGSLFSFFTIGFEWDMDLSALHLEAFQRPDRSNINHHEDFKFAVVVSYSEPARFAGFDIQ